MWIQRGGPYIKPPGYVRRNSLFVDRRFQLKYTFLILGAASLGMVVAVTPVFYFLNQNYKIFVQLAYQEAPELLKYLEHERIWINVLLASVFSGLLIFFSILGYKLTARIVGPIKIIKNHLKELSRGRWDQSAITIRDTDEFQDLIDAYNYFLKSFKRNAIKDFHRIKALSIDPSNRDAYLAWRELLEEKISQLKLPEAACPLTALSDELHDPSAESHRAS